jgi:hypothetical protein
MAAWSSALALTFVQLTGRPLGSAAGAVTAAPVLLAAWLATRPPTDRRQAIVRSLAVVLMAPIGLAMWATSLDGATAAGQAWAVGGAALLLQALAWAGHFLWAASVATRVSPPVGVPAVERGRLRARLQSLPGAGWPLRWEVETTQGVEAEWVLALQVSDDGARSHRLRLRPDVGQAVVRVVEELGTSGAAPASAEEASLRGPAEPAWDPVRPDAQRVLARARQTTTIDPERLEALPLVLDGDRVLAPARMPEEVLTGSTDQRGEWLVTLVVLLVTQSGWVWQPRLLRR